MPADEREAFGPPAEDREIAAEQVNLPEAAAEKARRGLERFTRQRPERGDQISRTRRSEAGGCQFERPPAHRSHGRSRGKRYESGSLVD
jgi:hypothetical protein